MPERTKYSQPVNPGDTGVRIRAGHFFNPKRGLPRLSGLECKVSLVLNETGELVEEEGKDTRTIAATYTPGKVVHRRNPNTDELTGETFNHDQFFADFYSVMRAEQLFADNLPPSQNA